MKADICKSFAATAPEAQLGSEPGGGQRGGGVAPVVGAEQELLLPRAPPELRLRLHADLRPLGLGLGADSVHTPGLGSVARLLTYSHHGNQSNTEYRSFILRTNHTYLCN